MGFVVIGMGFVFDIIVLTTCRYAKVHLLFKF